MTDRKDYEIGYGKPPVAHRFVPGQSGNPRGKPKGARDLKTEIAAELDERVSITVNGKQKRVRKLRLIIKALAQKAATGNVAAADKLLQMVIQSQGFEDTRAARKELSETDRLILDRLLGGEDDEDLLATAASEPRANCAAIPES